MELSRVWVISTDFRSGVKFFGGVCEIGVGILFSINIISDVDLLWVK